MMEARWAEMESLSKGLVQKQEDALDRWSEYVLPFAAFRSGFTFGGKPALPPVMNAERRQEMAMYRRQASIACARLKLRQRERASRLGSASLSSHASVSSEKATECDEEGHSGSPTSWSQSPQRAAYTLPFCHTASINVSDASGDGRGRTIWVAEPTSDESCNDRADEDATEKEQLDDWVSPAAHQREVQREACRRKSDPFAFAADLEDGGYGDSCEADECDPYSERGSAEVRSAEAATARSIALSTSVEADDPAVCCRTAQYSGACECSCSSSVCEGAWTGREEALRLSPICNSRSDDSFDGSEAESSLSETYCSLPSARARPPAAAVLSSAVTPPRPASPVTLAEQQLQVLPGSADTSSSPPLVRRNSYTLEHPSPALLRSRLANLDASISTSSSGSPTATADVRATAPRDVTTTATLVEAPCQRATSSAESTTADLRAAAPRDVTTAATTSVEAPCQTATSSEESSPSLIIDCRAEAVEQVSSETRFAPLDDEGDDGEVPACDAVVKRALALLKSKHGGRLASLSVDSAAIVHPGRAVDVSKSCTPSVAADVRFARQQQCSANGCGRRSQRRVASDRCAVAPNERSACDSRVVATVRGYLTRQLLKTGKVELLRKTIKDCLKIQEDEEKAAVTTAHAADVNFRRRIADELSIARQRLHSLFFDASLASERSRLLAQSAVARRRTPADRAAESKVQDRFRQKSNRRTGSRSSGTISRQATGLVSRVTAMVIERRASKKSLKPACAGQKGALTRQDAPGHLSRRQLSIAAAGVLEQQRED